MTDYQQVQFKMILETLELLKTSFNFADAAKQATSTILEKHYIKAVDIKKEIVTNIEIQESDISGYARRKKEQKNSISEFDYELSSGLRSFANDTDNAPVYDEFDLSVSKINKLSDINFVTYSKNLITNLNKYKKEVEAYGVSADDIDKLSLDLAHFNNILLEPAQHKDQKKVASQNIKELISEELNLFKTSIDNHMEQYRTSKPDLYKNYQEARQIDDNRTTALSIRGKITGGEAEIEVLEYVHVTAKFKAGTDWKEMSATSTAKGNYQFKGVPDGMCTVTFEKNYYQTIVVESEVHHQKATQLNVVMKKAE